MDDGNMLNAHQAGRLLGVTKARVHQLAVPGPDGEEPVLPPTVEVMSPSGRVTQRLWDRELVLELVRLRELYPPQGRGTIRWTRDLAGATR